MGLRMVVTATSDGVFCSDPKHTGGFFGILQNINKYMYIYIFFKITKSIFVSLEGQDKRGQYTTDMHCMKRACLNTGCVHRLESQLRRQVPSRLKTTILRILDNIHVQKQSPRRSSQRSRLASLSRWFFRSWKTSVKKCGSAFSCSILALILLMMRSDVSQNVSLFASIMNGLSG